MLAGKGEAEHRQAELQTSGTLGYRMWRSVSWILFCAFVGKIAALYFTYHGAKAYMTSQNMLCFSKRSRADFDKLFFVFVFCLGKCVK